jgi:hypothetical protein
LDIKNLLCEIQNQLTDKKHLVSIAGSLRIENIEKIHNGKISRIFWGGAAGSAEQKG